ncbi:hypothetical protein [Rhodopseudomonas sp. BR0G17]|uniref:hypothetical protein n=1 Tax=Rhodopseudomonas sp. BR0G17 TaxID=2269368 RepID=UPI0013E02CA2|nr:hypothetical protein [Rhodopseudomonas sp. BR0G17]NEW96646.1 hypothetical protein [Rhodopseudomonas sp. BR0G17]
MSQILEALAVIKGRDETGRTFETVAGKIKRLAQAANALNRDVQRQVNLAATAERSASRLSRASTAIGSGMKAAAGAAAAYEGSRIARAVAERTVRAASDRGHEETRMAAAGMTPGEIKDAEELSAEISRKYKSLSTTEMMHTARNVRSMVGTFEEASHILEPLAQLRVVALGAHPERAAELGDDFDKLAKGMEIKGVTQNLDHFRHYIDGMAKAVNVFGDTLRPTDYYEMFKYGRAATNALSDDFMLKTAPTLAQELGGSSAGKALASFYTQFVGGKMSNKAVEQLAKYDMLDMKKVIRTKTGNVKGVLPGGIIGAEYLKPEKTDPYQWVNKVLIPHLAKKGITDPSAIQEVIAAMASQQTTAQMMAIFATQQARIEKDKHLVEGAKGVEAAELYQKNDPKVARKSIESQSENFLTETAKPFIHPTVGGLNWLSDQISSAAEEAKKNPLRAAGGLGFGAAILAAFGLDSFASSLSVAGNLFRGEGAAGGLRLGSTKLASWLAPIIEVATRTGEIVDTPEMRARQNQRVGLEYERRVRLDSLDRADDRLPNVRPESWLGRRFQAERDRNAAERARINAELEDRGFGPAGVPGRGMMAGSYSAADIGRALGLGGAGEPAKAEVVGNATLETKVTVSPSPDFLSRVEQTVTNAINAFRSSGSTKTGSTGSTGRSSPDAAPAP